MKRIKWFLPLLALLGVTAAGFHMADSVTGTASIVTTGAQSSSLALGSASYQPKIQSTITYAYGTGTSAIQLLWTDTSTVAASSADTVMLRGSVLTDAFGNPVNFGKVKTITITAATANTNNVVLGNAADSAWVGPFAAGTNTIAIKPGGYFSFALPGTGWDVTDATKKLKIANSGAGSTVKYTIMIMGIP